MALSWLLLFLNILCIMVVVCVVSGLLFIGCCVCFQFVFENVSFTFVLSFVGLTPNKTGV